MAGAFVTSLAPAVIAENNERWGAAHYPWEGGANVQILAHAVGEFKAPVPAGVASQQREGPELTLNQDTQGNSRSAHDSRVSSSLPAWADKDWEETVERFSEQFSGLSEDVKKAVEAVGGRPDYERPIGLEDVWDAVAPVLFDLQRLTELLSSINPRVGGLWKKRRITWEQVQFYVLRLFCEARASVEGCKAGWLPPIPDRFVAETG